MFSSYCFPPIPNELPQAARMSSSLQSSPFSQTASLLSLAQRKGSLLPAGGIRSSHSTSEASGAGAAGLAVSRAAGSASEAASADCVAMLRLLTHLRRQAPCAEWRKSFGDCWHRTFARRPTSCKASGAHRPPTSCARTTSFAIALCSSSGYTISLRRLAALMRSPSAASAPRHGSPEPCKGETSVASPQIGTPPNRGRP